MQECEWVSAFAADLWLVVQARGLPLLFQFLGEEELPPALKHEAMRTLLWGVEDWNCEWVGFRSHAMEGHEGFGGHPGRGCKLLVRQVGEAMLCTRIAEAPFRKVEGARGSPCSGCAAALEQMAWYIWHVGCLGCDCRDSNADMQSWEAR